jgi:hypothetical protein
VARAATLYSATNGNAKDPNNVLATSVLATNYHQETQFGLALLSTYGKMGDEFDPGTVRIVGTHELGLDASSILWEAF